MNDYPDRVDGDSHIPRSDGIPEDDLGASVEDLQPESQGETPLDAELGEDGQGDILVGDEPDTSDGDDAPDDLRVEDLP